MWVYIYTEEQEWQPWENTLLYMPLNWDTKDEVSGSNWTWGWTAQYETLDSWIKVANCNTSSYILTPSVALNGELTICWWLKQSSGYILFRADSTNPRNLYEIETWTSGTWWWWYYNTSSYLIYQAWYSWWKNIIATFSQDGIKVTVNWTLVWSNPINSFVWKTQQWGINLDQSSSVTRWAWYYSNLILENKARTEAERLAYYNLTKSNYWL